MFLSISRHTLFEAKTLFFSKPSPSTGGLGRHRLLRATLFLSRHPHYSFLTRYSSGTLSHHRSQALQRRPPSPHQQALTLHSRLRLLLTVQLSFNSRFNSILDLSHSRLTLDPRSKPPPPHLRSSSTPPPTTVKIGIIYLLSGFGGSVLSSLFIRNSISIGTSSALVGLLGAMLSELITNWTLYSDKENIRRCVRIIYDPSRSDQGVLALKALKLSDSFMELYRSKNFTIDKLRRTYHGWISMRKYLSNSTIVACLISRPSSKHGFRREL